MIPPPNATTKPTGECRMRWLPSMSRPMMAPQLRSAAPRQETGSVDGDVTRPGRPGGRVSRRSAPRRQCAQPGSGAARGRRAAAGRGRCEPWGRAGSAVGWEPGSWSPGTCCWSASPCATPASPAWSWWPSGSWPTWRSSPWTGACRCAACPPACRIGRRHHGERPGDHLTGLADVVHLAPLGETVSAGDIVLSLGVARSWWR